MKTVKGRNWAIYLNWGGFKSIYRIYTNSIGIGIL